VRKIAATYIFPGNGKPVKNGILVCENDGTVIEIIDSSGDMKEQAGLEYYSGILVPGFVNAHCHLELSHLKGLIPENAGMEGFLKEINRLRKENFENAVEIYRKADRKMWYNGIVAVGDISNTTATIQVKINSKIKYHTFVESFGFHPARAEKSFSIAEMVQSEFNQAGLITSIVPHSSYSVSEPLFQKIVETALHEKSILTIHNQESKAEADFFSERKGPIAEHFRDNLDIDISHWKPAGKSSLEFLLQFITAENQLLLIHNTFSGKADIELVKSRRSIGNTYFVLCPLSNLYIENQLPPVELFQHENLNICIGTDSLASNHQLSVLAEMLVLQQNFPEIKLEELIKWACFNGARALKMDAQLGSFEKGKKPGVNLISGIDFKKMKLTEKSRVKKLI
jgi:aminodeoxyfutalosine deaminase